MSTMALRQALLSRSRSSFAWKSFGNPVARPRFYSRASSNDARKPLLDRKSGTWLGVTAGLLLGGFYVTHLEPVPETGRRRFMAVSMEQEGLLRQQALKDTLEQFRGKILPMHHPLTQEVRRITRRIITASNLGYLEGDESERTDIDSWSTPMDVTAAEIPRPPTMHPDKEWVVVVVDDMNFVNAFAAPGLVCVSTGIIPVAGNEEGLAAVIGHEIGHVAMRHSAEHLSQYKLLLPVMGLLLLLGLDLGLSSMLTNVLHSLPHSRALETEGKLEYTATCSASHLTPTTADIVGLKLMSRACYNPDAAVWFFENMKKFEKVEMPSFLRTHPATSDRIAHLKTLLPESRNIYNSNPECHHLEDMRGRGILGTARYKLALN
ncbi:peptidase family M48-domain-containing protein [Mycena capillaripes]|nr:peptidase family M48-domain-containing protein [Mycena capillaripes]